MSRWTEALKSIASTGMPEGNQPPQGISGNLKQVTRGGAKEMIPPAPQVGAIQRLTRGGVKEIPAQTSPTLVQRVNRGAQEQATGPGLFNQGVNEVANQAKAQLGTRIAGTAIGAILGGAVEQPDQEAIAKKAAAAEKRSQMAKNVLSTAANLAASGIKGTTGLAVRGILWGINTLRKSGKKEQPAQQPTQPVNPSTPMLNAENHDVVEGEWREV